MSQPRISVFFEIVGGRFVFCCSVPTQAERALCEVDSQTVIFRGTNITLRLINDEPKVELGEACLAEFHQLSYILRDGQHVSGRFVRLRIY